MDMAIYRAERLEIYSATRTMATKMAANGDAKATLRPLQKLAFPLDNDDL
jgi:hypothetical protein